MNKPVDEYTVITLLHSLAAISPQKAKSINELAFYLKCQINDLKKIIERLHQEGYVDRIDDKLFLTTKGWLKVLMYYT